MPLSTTKNLVCRLRMLPTPWPSAMVAFTGADRFRVNVLVGPPVTTVVIGTVTVSDVTPGAKVRVPDVAV